MLNYITVLMPQDLLTLCPNTYFFFRSYPFREAQSAMIVKLACQKYCKYRCSPAISCSWTTYLWTTIRQIPYRDSNRSPFHEIACSLTIYSSTKAQVSVQLCFQYYLSFREKNTNYQADFNETMVQRSSTGKWKPADRRGLYGANGTAEHGILSVPWVNEDSCVGALRSLFS